MFHELTEALLQEIDSVHAHQAVSLEKTAEMISGALQKGHRFFALGAGHDHMAAEELYARLGGLDDFGVKAILYPELMPYASRCELVVQNARYADIILSDNQIDEGDVLLLVADKSSVLMEELCLRAKMLKVKTIVISSSSQWNADLVLLYPNSDNRYVLQVMLAQLINVLTANALSSHPAEAVTVLDDYMKKIQSIILELEATQKKTIEKLADLIWANTQQFVILGSGHSHLITEAFWRNRDVLRCQCVLEPELMIFDQPGKSGIMESSLDYAQILMDQYEIKTKDLVWFSSNSGTSLMTIELAKKVWLEKATVIALTNMKQSPVSRSKHPSGRRLFETADIILDNCCKNKDACMEIDGVRRGPTSSFIGLFIVELLTALVKEKPIIS